jgi:hypothetical protein
MRLGNTTTRSPPSAHRAHCLVRASLPQQLVFHGFFTARAITTIAAATATATGTRRRRPARRRSALAEY